MTLAVRNLSFRYGRTPVLSAISVPPLTRGAVTALIGPNAAGKSTLLRCIAGLVARYSGSVTWDAKPLEELSTRERVRRVCFMPQFFASNAALTVFEVVLLSRKNLAGWAVENDDVDVVAQVLAELGIANLAERDIGALSGGQQQLVSIGQALVRSPDVFLFDEPTSALDLKHQLEVMSRIRKETVARETVTVVAMHDLNLAARFADRLVLMRDGAVLSSGPPNEVLRDPALAQTYGVSVDLLHHEHHGLHVHASLA
ncbi:MAG: ABC transporter ATP-binding protein [Pseudomonadota bacterium]